MVVVVRPIFDSIRDGCSEVRKAADRVFVLAFEHMQMFEKHLPAQFDVGSCFQEFACMGGVIAMRPRSSHILAVHFGDAVIEERDDFHNGLRTRSFRGDDFILF